MPIYNIILQFLLSSQAPLNKKNVSSHYYNPLLKDVLSAVAEDDYKCVYTQFSGLLWELLLFSCTINSFLTKNKQRTSYYRFELCSMLQRTYYAQNYTGILCKSLSTEFKFNMPPASLACNDTLMVHTVFFPLLSVCVCIVNIGTREEGEICGGFQKEGIEESRTCSKVTGILDYSETYL